MKNTFLNTQKQQKIDYGLLTNGTIWIGYNLKIGKEVNIKKGNLKTDLTKLSRKC